MKHIMALVSRWCLVRKSTLAIATVSLLMVVAGACTCGEHETMDPVVGEECDEEGERDGNLVCEDGEWVHDEWDAGYADTDDPDADEDCEAEDHEEFCDRHEVECGSLTAEDNCGEERTVHCEDYEGFGCEDPEVCRNADDDDDLDTNECRCPETGDDPAATICDYADAECGSIEAGDVCDGWENLGEVECGECEGEDECGEELDNVCGCPCEIDGECYAAGETSDDDACMICDPEEDDEEFTEADDGTECDDNAVCDDGDCVCEDDATECGDECVDTSSDRDHCGECYNDCDDNQVCSDGECEDGCDDDETLCDEECVDQEVDDDHCGECNNECSTDDDSADAFCEDGECVYECDVEGETYCEETDECTDTDNDVDNCGECGNECLETQWCDDGSCVGFDGGECEEDDECLPAQQCCENTCIGQMQPCPEDDD